MNSDDFFAAADSPAAGDLPERFAALAAVNYLEAETPDVDQLLPQLRRRRLGRNLMNTGFILTTLFTVAGLVLTASHLNQGELANPAERGAAGLASSLVCGQAFPSATELGHIAPRSAALDGENRWTAYVPALVGQQWTHEVEADGTVTSVAPQGTEVYLLDEANRVIGYSDPFLNAADTGTITVITDDVVRVSAPLAGQFEFCTQTQSESTGVSVPVDPRQTDFRIGIVQRATGDESLSNAAILAPTSLQFSNEVSISTNYARFAQLPGLNDAFAQSSPRQRILIDEQLQREADLQKIATELRTLLELAESIEP